MAYISFQEVCLPETGDCQYGGTVESDYKAFVSALALKVIGQSSILSKEITPGSRKRHLLIDFKTRKYHRSSLIPSKTQVNDFTQRSLYPALVCLLTQPPN